MASVIKNYLAKKSKFGLIIDIIIALMILFLIIPATRKNTIALILKPTMFIHQAGELKEQKPLQEATYQWKLINLDGTKVTLNDFRDKVIFINLWATWCPPCIAEMPQLQKLYDQYGDKVAFLFISNEVMTTVEPFISKKEFTFPVYIPITDYPADFETHTLPTSFIISKEGKMVVAKHGVAQWNSKKVKGILDKLVAE